MVRTAAVVPVRARRREAFGLTALIVVAIAAFLITRAVAAANRRMHLDDAARWAQLAEGQMAADRPAEAVPALRRAVSIDRDSQRYRLSLAGALAASGQDESARQVLASLRQLAPEDPQVNLELARLETRRQDVTAAVQFYQNALYGRWPPDRVNERRAVRRELIEFLLRRGEKSRALSELLILSGNVPDEADAQRQIASLFLGAGDPRRALDHFAAALRLAPADEASRAGAGEAAFAAGDYLQARHFLRRTHDLPDRLVAMRAVADLVVTADPLAPRLAPAERYRRLRTGLDRARQRAEGCSDAAAAAVRAELEDFGAAATMRTVREDPDLVERGVALVGRAIQQTAGCGAETTADRGWLAIAARHRTVDE